MSSKRYILKHMVPGDNQYETFEEFLNAEDPGQPWVLDGWRIDGQFMDVVWSNEQP